MLQERPKKQALRKVNNSSNRSNSPKLSANLKNSKMSFWLKERLEEVSQVLTEIEQCHFLDASYVQIQVLTQVYVLFV